METNYVSKKNLIEVCREKNEKIFCVSTTILSDEGATVRVMEESELDSLGLDLNEWTKSYKKLEIGETATWSYWFADNASIITRLA